MASGVHQRPSLWATNDRLGKPARQNAASRTCLSDETDAAVDPRSCSLGVSDPQGSERLRLVPCSISSTDAGRLWVPRYAGHGNQVAPPAHVGPRITEQLTKRGARALQDASRKAYESGRGFRAHWTFTFAPEAREALERGDITVGGEMRRTINALQEWNRRHGKPALRYEWVAENPLNAAGERNPHVHMNLDYLSTRKTFREYAAFVESCWGHGHVHQERIRDARAAAAYLLKCVGYVSKGTQSGQGPVVGNRYGVSASLRAVSLEPVEVDDGDGRLREGLDRVCSLPGSVQYRHLGRGAFATRFGVGTHPWSALSMTDLVHLLRESGYEVEGAAALHVPDMDPRFAWCREHREAEYAVLLRIGHRFHDLVPEHESA